MIVRFTKRENGVGWLTCVRDDGSISRGPMLGGPENAAPHDMTHAVVELLGGFRKGFYGFVRDGMQIPQSLDANYKQQYKDEPETYTVEFLVNLFQSEKAYGATPSETFAQWIAYAANDSRLPVIDCATIDTIRSRCEELRREWIALPVGGTMEKILF